MVFQCINIRQVPWKVLKTAAFGLGFQHLPRDLANVNAWKNMFDPFINKMFCTVEILLHVYNVFIIWASVKTGLYFVLGSYMIFIK